MARGSRRARLVVLRTAEFQGIECPWIPVQREGGSSVIRQPVDGRQGERALMIGKAASHGDRQGKDPWERQQRTVIGKGSRRLRREAHNTTQRQRMLERGEFGRHGGCQLHNAVKRQWA